MSELLSCPFCGSDAELVHMRSGDDFVRCANKSCHARTRNYHEAAKLAAGAWNTRADSHCAFAQPTDLADGCALVKELEDAKAEIRKLERRGEYMVRQIAKAKEALR